MKKLLLKTISSVEFWFIATLMAVSCMYVISYGTAYCKGLDKGYNMALDTVNSIMKKQLKSDTSHCSYVIIDTSYYILEHKKCK